MTKTTKLDTSRCRQIGPPMGILLPKCIRSHSHSQIIMNPRVMWAMGMH